MRLEWSVAFKLQYAYVVMQVEHINRSIVPGLSRVERSLRASVEDTDDIGVTPLVGGERLVDAADSIYNSVVARAEPAIVR